MIHFIVIFVRHFIWTFLGFSSILLCVNIILSRMMKKVGVGRGTAQVLYHQQQVRSVPQPKAGPLQRPPDSNNAGYQSGYQSQTKQQDFSDAPRVNQPYQAEATPTKSILKQPIVSPVPVAMPVSNEVEIEENGDEIKKEDKPNWVKKFKKGPGFKIDRKVKKRRMNARLRKILQPKNATMILNELKTNALKMVSPPFCLPNTNSFSAQVEFEGQLYTGRGGSGSEAKQNAAENALRCYLTKMMMESSMKATDGQTDGAATEEGNKNTKPKPAEEDLPWGSLASFALYKLFEDWQSPVQDISAKFMEMSAPPVFFLQQPAVQQASKKPLSSPDQHPVAILNQMKPGLIYSELKREPGPDNTILFTISVEVEGQKFNGVAKSKKEAKREAAAAALKTVFNVNTN